MTLTAAGSGVSIITGAAGGMGVASAAMFAGAGRHLLLSDLSAERLDAVAEPLRRAGGRVDVIAGDIADLDYPAKIVSALGGKDIDALVHTAGLSPTMADAERIMLVNFDATARLVDAVRSNIATGGCVVLIASSAAHMVPSEDLDRAAVEAARSRVSTSLDPWKSSPDLAYVASKRAVLKLVAREAAGFGARGARIVSISPGLIDTAMGRAEQEASAHIATLLEQTPLGRFGTAAEIASVALLLCSESASYITGCDVRVDGGTLAALGL